MARVILQEVPKAKAISSQLARSKVRKCLESLGSNPKPDDLALSKVKQLSKAVEA